VSGKTTDKTQRKGAIKSMRIFEISGNPKSRKVLKFNVFEILSAILYIITGAAK